MNPALPIVLQQLSLLGDFFNTPYSLGAVEWTLRIELVFYVFMGFFGVISRHYASFHPGRWPYFYAGLVILLGILPPFTAGEIQGGWASRGAFTLYFPFLLLGSMIYLYERRLMSLWLLAAGGICIYAQYYILMVKYQPTWSKDHHALLALVIFLVLWIFRKRLKADGIILFASSLTYSVYLFHNWLYFVIRDALTSRGIEAHSAMTASFLCLLAVCIASMHYVEKPGINLGKKTIQMLNRNFPQR